MFKKFIISGHLVMCLLKVFIMCKNIYWKSLCMLNFSTTTLPSFLYDFSKIVYIFILYIFPVRQAKEPVAYLCWILEI